MATLTILWSWQDCEVLRWQTKAESKPRVPNLPTLGAAELALQSADDTLPWQGEHCMIHQALNEKLKKILKHRWTSAALPYHVLVRNNHSHLLQKLSFTPS